MSPLTLESTRSGFVESVHRVSVAVTDGEGRLVASSGEPGLAKVGAEGVYSAALPALGLGLTLKVESGDGRCSPPALLAVLRQVLARSGAGLALPAEGLTHHEEPVLRNTRGEVTGALRVTGELRFH